MDLKQNKTFSPKQFARAIGVSEASIKRWCDKGILVFSKTAGGHRRLALHVILGFIKENDFHLIQPELLGLPAAVGGGVRTVEQACRIYCEALEQGDEARCLQVAFDMRLAGHDMATICDRLIASTFRTLGQRWEYGEVAVYQERRGVEITRQVIFRLKDTLAPALAVAPMALGATLTNDHYSLAGLLGELVLLEQGWQACFLGSNLPTVTVAQAVQDLQPRVLWLSVSNISDVEEFTCAYRHLYEICLGHQCAVVVGGRALTESLRQEIQYTSYGDRLQHLKAFAQNLYRTESGIGGK